MDSLFIVRGICHILQYGYTGSWSNHDLWLRLADLVALQLTPHWIPSHLNPAVLEDPFEEWVHHWNGVVDKLIARYNQNRPRDFLELQQSLENWHRGQKARIQQNRQFWFNIAKDKQVDTTEVDSVCTENFVPDDQLTHFFRPLCWQRR